MTRGSAERVIPLDARTRCVLGNILASGLSLSDTVSSWSVYVSHPEVGLAVDFHWSSLLCRCSSYQAAAVPSLFFTHEAGPCCCSRITRFLPVAHVILGWGMHEGFFSPCLCPFCLSILLFLEDASISWLTGRWLCLRGIHPDELGWSRILKVDRAERW